MEVYVGVASKEWDVIDEAFGKDENLYIMCFLVDSEDKTIYRRSSIKATRGQFVEVAVNNKLNAFVYDTIDEKWEKELKAAGIKLYPGRTGSSIKAATDIFD